ncbi:MAG: YceI family protein [Chloroflexi bacterium]|nr:MAG: YceI family protein [Chloroflexota bacterium]
MAWRLDPYHTQVEFAVKHLGMMTVRGHFSDVTSSGTIDPENPANSSFEVTIDVASIKTHNPQRDNDLKSSNFLELEKYPRITFKSTRIEPAGADHYTMTGDLTIKGNTRQVTLPVMRYGEFNDPGMMGHRIAYSAEAQINRKDFGLTMDAFLDGRLVVGNEVKIQIEVEAVEQKAEAQKEQSAAATRA